MRGGRNVSILAFSLRSERLRVFKIFQFASVSYTHLTLPTILRV